MERRAVLKRAGLWAGLLVAVGFAVVGSAGAVVGSWTQVGADIDGEAAADWSGFAVEMNADGSRVIVGGFRNGGSAPIAGHARVYGLVGGAWVQVGADIDGESSGDEFGRSVGMSADGSRVIVGARYDDEAATNAGHVRVFEWSGSAWVQMGADIDGEAIFDQFGFDVAMSADGSRVIAGTPENDGNGTGAGHARVFEWSGSAWVQMGADIDGEAAGDASGFAVAIGGDGSRVIVGARNNDGTGNNAGHARVFEWSGSAWVQMGADIDAEAAEDQFGSAVAISVDGFRVIVGGSSNDGTANLAGHARVFEWSGSAWVQVGADIDGEAEADFFGASVAIGGDGSRVVVGGIGNDGTAANAGHVRVLELLAGVWEQVGADIDGEAAGDSFGIAVAMSADRSRVIAGAYLNDGTAADAGHARVFDVPLLCGGEVPTILVPPGGALTFGTSGDDVILGTSGADNVAGIAGDDLICGEGGDDTLNGGNGSDMIFGGPGDDVIGGQGAIDTLFGEGGDDELNGGIGNDIMRGGHGEDLLRGQGNADQMFGDGGVDTFFGGSGNDVIVTGPGGNAGTAHVVTGNGNNDTITGSPDADVLDGQNGLDIVNGGGGDDTLTGGLGFDRLNGDAGNDDLQGAGSRDILHGGDDDDTLSGGDGPDDLFGDDGVDEMDGGPGDDLCDGGAGSPDTVVGLSCETVFDVP